MLLNNLPKVVYESFIFFKDFQVFSQVFLEFFSTIQIFVIMNQISVDFGENIEDFDFFSVHVSGKVQVSREESFINLEFLLRGDIRELGVSQNKEDKLLSSTQS